MTMRTPLLPLLGLGLLCACGDPDTRIAGNAANTGNAQAAGRLTSPDGDPAPGVRVSCRPDTLAPRAPTRPEWNVLTKSDGTFLCTELPPGPTAVVAGSPGSGLTSWNSVVLRPDQTDSVPTDTLAPPGNLRIALPPGSTGTVVLSGLAIDTTVDGVTELVVSGIPARWTGSVRLVLEGAPPTTIGERLHVPPGGTDSAGFTRNSATLRLALPGRLAAPLLELPLLVRIDGSWDGFASALPDGSDLRLSRPDGRILPATIASWNPAELWTLLDTLAPPGDSIDLVLSWGLPVPAPNPSPFASNRGWLAAWPLGGTSSVVTDLAGSFPGTASSLGSAAGVVGTASVFDGRKGAIEIAGSETGALDFPAGGPYTLSCWARLDAPNTSRVVMGQGENDYFLKFQKDWSTPNNWMAKDSRASPRGGFYALAPADSGRWTHLAMVVRDSTIQLFVDGRLSDSASLWDKDTTSKSQGPFRIGAASDATGAIVQRFQGLIDEAWVQSKARPPDWIRFVASNQDPFAKRAAISPR
jgi:hypothetical protein